VGGGLGLGWVGVRVGLGWGKGWVGLGWGKGWVGLGGGWGWVGGGGGGGGGIFFPALIEREIAPTKDLTYSEHRRHRDRRKARQEYKTRSGSEVASPPSHPI